MKINILGFLFIVFFYVQTVAQDDSEENVQAEQLEKELLQKETNYLDFENNFILAVQERTKENYDKALQYLGTCENIYPENPALFFEKSKTYFEQKKYAEAHYYCDKLLATKPNYFWGLSLKRDLYLAEQNFSETLVLQMKLYEMQPNEVENLLKLYVRLRNYEAGKSLFLEAQQKAIYVENINYFAKVFKIYPKEIIDDTLEETLVENPAIDSNTQKNTDVMLQTLLNQKDFVLLYSESSKAVFQHPTEPQYYYYNGIALNGLKKYNNAIEILASGLDFIFDDDKQLADFYQELQAAYFALKNTKKANYYGELVQKLRKP